MGWRDLDETQSLPDALKRFANKEIQHGIQDVLVRRTQV